jgi:hypothetical protein
VARSSDYVSPVDELRPLTDTFDKVMGRSAATAADWETF